MAQRTQGREVVAAGAVVTRPGSDLPEVLLVHRPRYDDWSLPKGKLDRGEGSAAAAVREVAEETGLTVRLGVSLGDQRYQVGRGRSARDKRVHYWTAEVVGDDDVAGYTRGDEIDGVAWVPWRDALRLLTHHRDRATVREAAPWRRRTETLVVLRHAEARARKSWRPSDRERPLNAAGGRQAVRLVPLLAAYGVERVVSSSSTRCVETVAPYADTAGAKVRTRDALSEEDATADGVADVLATLEGRRRPVVLCTHRPVLPLVWDALGTHEARLEPGGMLVVHRRGGLVLACHEVRAPRG